MAKARGSVQVRDPKVLAGLRQARELHERAAEVEEQIDRLLDPIKDRLRELVLKRDRLLYEALGARQKFFAAAKKAYPQLDMHRSLRCEAGADKAYIRWDDTGPHFATGEGAELPQLHPFIRRRPGRRAWDLIFWLR